MQLGGKVACTRCMEHTCSAWSTLALWSPGLSLLLRVLCVEVNSSEWQLALSSNVELSVSSACSMGRVCVAASLVCRTDLCVKACSSRGCDAFLVGVMHRLRAGSLLAWMCHRSINPWLLTWGANLTASPYCCMPL